MNPVSAYLNSRESTTLGKQRVIFFFVTAVFSVLLTVATFFYQTKDTAALVTDSINIVLCFLFVFLYFYRALTIREASNMLYIMLQLDLCVHKILLCLSGGEDISAFLIQDSFLSLLLIMISIVANLKYCPAIISVLSLVTYFVCYFLTRMPVLLNFLPVYLVVLVGVILYDTYAMRGAQLLEAENFHLKEELAEFMAVTGLSLADIREITQLSKGSARNVEKTRFLLNKMDARVRENIVGGVLAVKAQNESSKELLMAVFPQFTPSQIAISQLILQDKKLSEICRSLGKTENNVSSQRSKIRTILELGPEDSLKDALQERLDAYLQARQSPN